MGNTRIDCDSTSRLHGSTIYTQLTHFSLLTSASLNSGHTWIFLGWLARDAALKQIWCVRNVITGKLYYHEMGISMLHAYGFSFATICEHGSSGRLFNPRNIERYSWRFRFIRTEYFTQRSSSGTIRSYSDIFLLCQRKIDHSEQSSKQNI